MRWESFQGVPHSQSENEARGKRAILEQVGRDCTTFPSIEGLEVELEIEVVHIRGFSSRVAKTCGKIKTTRTCQLGCCSRSLQEFGPPGGTILMGKMCFY